MSRPLNPTRKDIAAWRRLLEEARACANNPARPTGDLFARVAATAKAVFPTGVEARANAWSRLHDAATVYCAKRAERGALAHVLADHCRTCAAELEDPAPSGSSACVAHTRTRAAGSNADAGAGAGCAPPRSTLRYRADLDG